MPSHGVRLVEVGDEVGQRLDNFLLAIMKGVPRSRVYRMLRRGEVRVNGGRARPTYRVCRGDAVRVPPHRAAEPDSLAGFPARQAAMLRERVVYEDRGILVLDKPSGLAAHGGSGVSFGVIELLRRLDPDTRYELAHRLDRDTSGCLAVAKRRSALTALHAAFRDGAVGKRYDLVVSGRWPASKRTVRDALERYRLPNGERRVRIAPGGDPARTDFAVVARRDDASADAATWLAATPRTGSHAPDPRPRGRRRASHLGGRQIRAGQSRPAHASRHGTDPAHRRPGGPGRRAAARRVRSIALASAWKGRSASGNRR